MKGYSTFLKAPGLGRGVLLFSRGAVRWVGGSKIHRLHLCSGVRPHHTHNECSGYDIKQSDSKAQVKLGLWGMR